ncbi:MAG: hypothetical protein D6800_07505, partial [Candidatus Zixiibacteriota bacterium]
MTGMTDTPSGKTSYRRMLKQSSVYMAGELLARVISFIMLPIYTRYLTPSDYGILELLSMTVDIVATLAGAGISSALLRFYSEKETIAEKNKVVSTAFFSASALFFISFGAVFLFADPVAGMILETVNQSNLVRIVAASMALTATYEIPLVLLRAQQRPGTFVTINACKLAVQLS